MSGLNPKTVVVPIDFSDLSLAALDRAVEIAGKDGAIHVIHVLAELSTMEPGNLYGTVTDATRIKSVEEHLRTRLSDDNYSGVTVHAAVGDAGREITALAEARCRTDRDPVARLWILQAYVAWIRRRTRCSPGALPGAGPAIVADKVEDGESKHEQQKVDRPDLPG